MVSHAKLSGGFWDWRHRLKQQDFTGAVTEYPGYAKAFFTFKIPCRFTVCA